MKKFIVLFTAIFLLVFSAASLAASYEKTVPVENYWQIPKEYIIVHSQNEGWQVFYTAYKKEHGFEFLNDGGFSGIIVPYLPSLFWMEKKAEEFTLSKEEGWADTEFNASKSLLEQNMIFQIFIGHDEESKIFLENLSMVYEDSLGNKIEAKPEYIKSTIRSNPPEYTYFRNIMAVRIPYTVRDLAGMKWFSFHISSNTDENSKLDFKWFFDESASE